MRSRQRAGKSFAHGALQRVARSLVACLIAGAPSFAPASVFYKFNVVAETGVSPTASTTILGNGPSINSKGKVAYVGVVTNQADETVYLWSPSTGTSTDIGLGHPQNRTYGANGTGTVHLNENDEVVAWTHTFAPQNTYEVRIFGTPSPSGNSIMVRGSSGTLPYDLLYANPWINNTLALEDDSSMISSGNKDGKCDAGEVCVPQTAFNAFTSAPARFLGTVLRNPEDAADAGSQNSVGLDSRQSRPMIADDGRVLVRGNLSTNPIILYDDYRLTSQTQIASTGMGFTALGLAPGMTPDGKIVAFAGDRGHGQGIFLSIETAPGTRRLVRIVGENTTVQKAELGVDGSGNKLYFQSIDVDSRVGIIYTPDYLGAANKSVVVSFIGTPNGASRVNPGTGKPFGFSNQKGLWTIRIDLEAPLFKNMCVVNAPGIALDDFTAKGDDVIDTSKPVHFVSAGPNGICESENAHDTELLFSRSSPIPVVQVGDTIHSTSNHVVVGHRRLRPDRAGEPHARSCRAHGTQRRPSCRVLGVGRQRDEADDRPGGAPRQRPGRLARSLGDDRHRSRRRRRRRSRPPVDGRRSVQARPLHAARLDRRPGGSSRTPGRGFRHRPVAGIMRKLADFYASAPALPNGIPAGITLHVDAGPTAKDVTGQFFTRNMGSGATVGGQTYPGAPVDILYQGRPGTVSIPNVNAVSFDTAKSALFWSHNRGAREFAFMHIVFTDFHDANNASGNDDNVNPVVGHFTSST